MARFGVRRPKRLGERYESLAGGKDERRMCYMLRRHMGIEPEEVNRLPWWKLKLYVEGIMWEFGEQEPDEYVESTPENLAEQGFTVNSYTV